MIKIWGRRIAALASSFVLVCSLAACGLSNQSDVTTLAADENGKLTHTIIESVGENDTAKELSNYIEEQIDEADSAVSSASDASAGTVSLKSCKVSNGKATIVMEYSSFQAYENFNRTVCFLGTIEEAEAAGYDVTGQQYYDENGKAADNQEELTQRANEWNVLIFEEPMNVRVADKILYTTANLEVTGRLTASWSESEESVSSSSEQVSSSSGGSGETAVSGSESVVASSSGEAVVSGSGNASADSENESAASEFAPELGQLTYVIFK